MIIIQLLKDTKYPANYQIIIDSSLGNYAVLRDFFSALHEGHWCPRSVRKSCRLRWKCLSMDCICSDKANLSAHLHRLPTPPPYLRQMRLSPGRGAGIRWVIRLSPGRDAGVWCWIWLLPGPVHRSCKSPRARILVLGTSGAHWPARWPRFELTERVDES